MYRWKRNPANDTDDSEAWELIEIPRAEIILGNIEVLCVLGMLIYVVYQLFF